MIKNDVISTQRDNKQKIDFKESPYFRGFFQFQKFIKLLKIDHIDTLATH